MADRVIVDEPCVTGNALLLIGVIAGSISRMDIGYSLVTVDGEYIIVESPTGNRFRVRAEQISGVE